MFSADEAQNRPGHITSEHSSERKQGDTQQSNPHDATLDEVAQLASSAVGDASAPDSPMSVDEFVACLSASGLMSADDVRSLCENLSGEQAVTDVESLAAELIRRKKLTGYQAAVLRQRQTKGLVFGNYAVLEKLGAGGMGMVFKAYHRRMKRVVALKVLPPNLTSSPAAVSRFHREVEAAAKLSHPNIVAAHDADEADGVHFLVMEHVAGVDLSRYVKEVGAMSTAAALDVILQTAHGLEHAHAQGVIHRDIKPSNLLLNQRGIVKILDMGLARLDQQIDEDASARDELTQSGRLMGTVDYMAPEQAADAKHVDLRADIYSLGCTLYYLLTGKPPGPDGSLTKKLLWHQTGEVPSLRAAGAAVSPRLDAVFQQMLSRTADERQPSMRVVIEQLDACLAEVDPDRRSALSTGTAGLDIARFHSQPTSADAETLPSGFPFDAAARTTSGYGAVTVPHSAAQPSQTSIEGPLVARASLGRAGLMFAGAAVVLLGVVGTLVAMRFFAPPPAPSSTMLSITVDQPDASVFVDDQLKGKSTGEGPLLAEVEPGAYRVRVTKQGFEIAEQAVTVVPGQTQPLSVHLEQVSDGEPLANGNSDDGPPADRPPPIQSGDFFRWVFDDLGGTMTLVTDDGRRVTVAKLDDVPREHFAFQSATFDGLPVTDRTLERLREADGLRELRLSNTVVGDQGLAKLAVPALSYLSSLDLSKTAVTDAGLAHLTKLKNLRVLNLQGVPVTDAGLIHLARIPSLEELYLSGTEVTDAGLDSLMDLDRLRVLALNGTAVTWQVVRKLEAGIPRLDVTWDSWSVERAAARQFVELGGSVTLQEPNAEARRVVTRSADLTDVNYHVVAVDVSGRAGVTDEDVAVLPALAELRQLDLSGTGIHDVTLDLLAQVGSLEQVDLGKLQLDPERVAAMRQALPRCNVQWNPTNDREVAEWVIAGGGSVSVLTADGERFAEIRDAQVLPAGTFTVRDINLQGVAEADDDNLERFDGLAGLETLYLPETRVTGAGLVHLGGCPSLRMLTLGGTALSKDGLRPLAALTQLETLYLSGPAVDDEVVRMIAPRLTSLKRLSLADTAVTDNAVSALDALGTLEELILSRTALTDDSLQRLSSLPALAKLLIDGTGITDAGVERLRADRRALDVHADPPDPQRLLARDIVSVGGVVRAREADGGEAIELDDIAALPRDACVISGVDLSGTEIQAAAQIVPRLSECAGIVELNLTSARVTDGLVREIAKLTSLESLVLAKTLIQDSQIARLGTLNKLRELDLEGCTFVVGSGLVPIAEHGTLLKLALRGTNVDDRVADSLPRLTRLQQLDMREARKLTDEGVGGLDSMRGLRSLLLGGTKVGDPTVKQLTELTQIEALDLGGTQVTDASMGALAGLEKLSYVELSGTGVTDRGLDAAKLTAREGLTYVGLKNTLVESNSPALGALKARLKTGLVYSRRIERDDRRRGSNSRTDGSDRFDPRDQ